LPDCAIDIEDVAQRTLRMQMGRQDAAVEAPASVSSAQEDRPGAVAEQYAGPAVLPVQNTGVDFAADHQDTTCLAGANHAIGDR
jgi:hypothetical protein